MICFRSGRARTGAAVASIALFALASPAGALSLADLKTDGFSTVSGGIEFSDFKVKLKGLGLDDELESHEVTFDEGRMQIDLAHGFQTKKGRVKVKYVATATGSALSEALLDVTGEDVSVKSAIKRVDKLEFSSDDPDAAVLGLALGELERIEVKTKIRVKTGRIPVDSSIGSSYLTAPEPGTVALCALGLAGMAAARRRRGE